MDDQWDIILIRHAESYFNQARINYCQKNKISQAIDWQILIKDQKFLEQIVFNSDFIDCSITPNGISQCLKAKSILQSQNINAVIVSPQKRALQTCKVIFGDHKIPFIVHPLLTEVFRYSCDVNSSTKIKIAQFNDFDFSEMKQWGQYWYLQCLSQKNQKRCRQQFQKEINTKKQKNEILLQLLKDKEIYETQVQLRKRVNLAKKMIKNYTSKYSKIAIVSHFYTLQCLTAVGFQENGAVKDKKKIQNAQPIKTTLEKMMSVS